MKGRIRGWIADILGAVFLFIIVWGVIFFGYLFAPTMPIQ